MFDFDPEEWFFLAAMLAVASVTGLYYYWPIFAVTGLGKGKRVRVALAVWPVVGLIITSVVLLTLSDSRVRGHPDYELFFLVGCAAWMGVAVWVLSVFGICARDDAVERDNPAAAAAVCGAMLAVAVVYAMANVGSGPTVQTTLAPAAAGAAGLGVVYLVIQLCGRSVVEAITVGRDLGAGVRLGGALAGAGIILGRAAGGNFVSWDETWVDMMYFGWPALALGAAAGMGHLILQRIRGEGATKLVAADLACIAGCIALGIGAVAMTPHGLSPSKW